MNAVALTTADGERWESALGRFERTDVYFLPTYHRAYELNGEGAARAFVFEDGNETLLHAFMLSAIDDEWSDIESVYGYTGPLSTSSDPGFLAAAWRAFGDWCRQEGVVAEFIRLNPFVVDPAQTGPGCEIEANRATVAMRLTARPEDLWADYPSGQRSKVRRAIRGGLTCEMTEAPEDYAAFRRLYRETMDRLGAAPRYYFGEAYFDFLWNEMGSQVRLFAVRRGDAVVAAGLFLLHGGLMHYHLGGSDANARDLRPNNLLFHAAAEWGGARGVDWLHLGGGLSSREDDSLLRFKASVSRERRTFYVGRRVHDREAYDRLCADWMARHGKGARPDYFLLYRREES